MAKEKTKEKAKAKVKAKPSPEQQKARRAALIRLGASLLLIILGISMVVWQELSLNTICIVAGSGAIVFGIVMIIIYFVTEVKSVGKSNELSLGAFAVILGIILLIRASAILDLLQFLIGLLLLADSVLKLQAAVDAKRMGIKGWWVILLVAALCIALGVIMILRLWTDYIMMLLGASLIAIGLQNIILLIFSKLAQKSVEAAEAAAAAAKEAAIANSEPAASEALAEKTEKAERPAPVAETVGEYSAKAPETIASPPSEPVIKPEPVVSVPKPAPITETKKVEQTDGFYVETLVINKATDKAE